MKLRAGLIRALSLSMFIAFSSGVEAFEVLVEMDPVGLPDLSKCGLNRSKFSVVYAGEIWPGRERAEPPSRERVLQVVRRRKDLTSSDMVILDVEHWPPNQLDKYISLLSEVRAVIHEFTGTESVKLGFFEVHPWSPYMLDPSRWSHSLRSWTDINLGTAGILPYVDYVFPSAYSRSDRMDDWRRLGDAVTQVAAAAGKPYFVFMWPQFYRRGTGPAPDFLPGSLWADQLEYIRASSAAGVVIWDSGTGPDGTPYSWDPKTEWWQATLAFMRRHQLGSPDSPDCSR